MGDPPSSVGTKKERETWVFPRVAERLVGGAGSVLGVPDTVSPNIPVPMGFMERTRKS